MLGIVEIPALYHLSSFGGRLEELEARIAPAIFIISGGTVVDGLGSDATAAHQGDADAAKATKAILLKKGDSLIIDNNGNGAFDKFGDTLVAQIKSGASLFFFTDTGAAGITASEISGLAVSDKFGGVINADVHGDIATLLGAGFLLNAAEAAAGASLSKLTINGSVEGNIFASGSIFGLAINSGSHQSAHGIYTGNALGDSIDFVLGSSAIEVLVSPTAAKSNSISNVVFQGGVEVIAAGSSAGKAGGALTGITIVNSIDGSDLSLVAGSGVSGAKASAGGSISAVTLKGDDFGSISVVAGNGGSGAIDLGMSGAIGGSVKKLSLLSGAVDLSVQGGTGGSAAYEYAYVPSKNPNDYGKVVAIGGAGGSGGSISGLIVSGLGVESLNVSAGAGGSGVMAFKSGLGGKVSGINAVLAANGSAFIKGGDGGEADKTGGLGGSVSGVTLHGDALGTISISGGDGGDSVGSLVMAGGGGVGGSISKINVLATSNTTGSLAAFSAVAGSGGKASYANFSPNPYADLPVYVYVGGSGGKGGAVKTVIISQLVAQSLSVSGGEGGESTYKFNGAAGGTVSGVTASVADLANAVVSGGVGGVGDPDFGVLDGLNGLTGLLKISLG